MVTVYLYDGSFEGLLCGVAQAVKSKQMIKGIYSDKKYSPELFDNVVRLDTDTQQALRLFTYLKSLRNEAVQFAMDAFLSEEQGVGIHLYWMVRECLNKGSEATRFYTHDSIRYLEQLSRKVKHEAHRFTGLIRFRVLADGLLYAPFEPDCNVIGHCADHFVRRLRNRRWLLHDVRRDYALYWDGESLQPADMGEKFTQEVRLHGEIPAAERSQEEEYYQNLWQSFHKTIANTGRINEGLQRQFMPRRYWKYLVEMEG